MGNYFNDNRGSHNGFVDHRGFVHHPVRGGSNIYDSGYKRKNNWLTVTINTIGLFATGCMIVRLIGVWFLQAPKLPFEPWMIWLWSIISILYALFQLAIIGIKAWHRYMDARERYLDIKAKEMAIRRVGRK